MNINRFVCILILSIFSYISKGQLLPVDRHAQHAYQKQTRDQSGVPGKAYWQNQGNYNIDVHFDPVSREVNGTVGIDYQNNSPDTLKTLEFKLYPNLYKSNAMRNTVLSANDLHQGMHLSDVTVNGQKIDNSKIIVRGTNMTLKGLELLPQQQTMVNIIYSYPLNKGSFNRTGQIDDGTFFLAYFFPRITVYDDVDGWNEYPYLGKEEFYNDYGDFKVSITVPSAYCVWATGELTNTNEVYEQKFVDRINRAEHDDGITDVITEADIEGGHITKSGVSHTWKFEAKNVIDFAFAVSRNYIWKASSIMVDSITRRRARVDAVYRPDHRNYTPVVEYNRKMVDIISHDFPGIPFPYSHETIIDGLDAMEYPMMVNNLPFEDPKDVVEFTAHEIFHTIFPFYVGTNETKYSFMDEGWATMTEFMFHKQLAADVPLQYDLGPVNDYAGLAEDMPVMTPTAQLYGKARFADKDLKPALSLWYLRDLLGEQKFALATQFYIRNWAGKHPTPYDFFNCINTSSGIDLNWYWKKWYFDKAVPDLAITKVYNRGNKCHIKISNFGGAPVPIHLHLHLADGSTQTISKTVMVWQNTDQVDITFSSKKKVAKITLGDPLDADVAPQNNIWKREGSG